MEQVESKTGPAVRDILHSNSKKVNKNADFIEPVNDQELGDDLVDPSNEPEGGNETCFETSLSYCDSFLGDDGCVELMQRVRTSSCLVRLDLRGNHIGCVGGESIADALRVNRSIEELTLEWNNIGNYDNVVRGLASSLEINQTLRYLDMRNNRIGPEGGASLARALRSNCGLLKLDIRWNEIGIKGGRLLALSLEEANRTLKVLKICGNNVSSEHSQRITNSLLRNGRLDADVAAAQTRLVSLSKSVHQDAAAIEQGQRPPQRKSEIDYDDDVHVDSVVFAERVIEIEMELKLCQDKLLRSQEETSKEHDKVEELTSKVRESSRQLCECEQAHKKLESVIQQEKSKLSESNKRVQELEKELSESTNEKALSEKEIERLLQDNSLLKQKLELEHKNRLGVDAVVEQLGGDIKKLHENIEQAERALSESREQNLRDKVNNESALSETCKTHAERVSGLEEKLEAEIKSRVEAIRTGREHVLAAEKKHTQQLVEAEAACAVQIRELEAKHENDRKEWEASLVKEIQKREDEKQQALEDLRRKLKQEWEQLEKQIKLDQEDACEKAVEVALKDAVQKAVTEAAREIESDHKRLLWKREKEIASEMNANAQEKINAISEENKGLEEQILALRKKLVDAEETYQRKHNALEKRMQYAISDVFK